MLSITLKSTWAHKRRLTGTVLAVVVGIAFLSGTLVLGDAMRAGFEDLFTDVYAGTDAVVRGEDTIGSDAVAQQALLDRSVVADVAAVDGVAAAVPYLEGVGQIVGADGVAIGGDGPPTLAGSWIDQPELNPYSVIEGRAPAEPGEVAIDRASAEIGGLVMGDTVVVRMPAPVEARIVGLIEPDGGSDFGGVSFAAFTLDEAQRYLAGGADVVSRVIVAADDGASQDDLVRRLLPIIPDGTEAVSGTDLTDEATDGISADFLDFFEAFLLAFAGIALLVAGFSIYNTFSITLAQRSRESALMRAIGSSSGQVLGSVALEAVIVGVVASVIGLVAGLGLAVGLAAVLNAVGFGIPTAAMSLDATTVAVSLGIGVVVTVLAAAVPAVRASRVAPLAALRDVAIDRSGVSVARAVIGGMLTAAGVALVVVAALGTGNALLGAGAGAVLTIFGVVTLGPVVARPVGRALGAPLRRLGITGSLARENAARNPRRTAGTASALMIGVAVVAMFTVVAASIEATIDDAVTGSIDSDLVVTAGGFSGSGLTPQLATALSDLDEVETAVGIGLGAARIDGEEAYFSTADPAALAGVMDIAMVEGSLTAVGPDGIAVAESAATASALEVGSPITLQFVDGSEHTLSVEAVYASSAGTDSLGSYIVPAEVWAAHSVLQVDTRVLVDLTDDVDPADGRAAVEAVTADFGSPDVFDRDEYAESLAGDVNQVLALIYVLLALAIVIALMGIANTLSLSVHERIRELGLLRAVGATRPQIRSMVRGEAVVVSLFGTVTGLALGTFLGWALMRAIAADQGIGLFSVPVGQLVILLGLGALVGVLAAVRPARRAARLDVLAAIATE